MTLQNAILQLLNKMDKGDLVVSSLGKISRELYEARLIRKEKPNDFYAMGSMGCALGIGLGLALHTPKQVYVFIGDGAMLMKWGSISTILKYKLDNLHIVIFNNNCHDSCGGQPTNFKQLQYSIENFFKIIIIERDKRKLKRIEIKPEIITKNFREKLNSPLQAASAESNVKGS